MHELSVCQGILETASAAIARLPPPPPRVAAVTVRVGRLTSIVAESLRFYFGLMTGDTPLKGASLIVEEVPIRGVCDECGVGFEIDTLCFTCPHCGSGFVELLSGRELEVVSLETYDEAERGN